MIRYALACENGHEFESWFPSGSAYDAQVQGGLVSCPICASVRVEKRLMAPSIATSRPAFAESVRSPALPVPAETAQPVALLSDREQAMRAMLRAVRAHVVKTADYVGPGFADEARRMHYGETEQRSIYGEANAADAKALLEEGIEVHALPITPDDRN